MTKSIDFGGTDKMTIKPLDDSNYFSWSFRMETILRHKQLWEATCTRPHYGFPEKIKKDEEALTFIRLSIDDDQIKHVHNKHNAMDTWHALKRVHTQDKPGKKIRLLREIVGELAQPGDNIPAHLDRMVEKFQRLTAMGELKTDSFLSALMLNSLPKSYDSIVLALEHKDDLNVNVVRRSIHEEYCRQTSRDGESGDAALKKVQSAQKQVRY